MEVVSASHDTEFELLERLHVEHNALERRLHELEAYPSLSHEEELERAQLKKLKLQKKDQIGLLARVVGVA